MGDEQQRAADFSVVIPLYNKRDHVLRAVDSALHQTPPPREVIVVDDGSSDGGGDLVRQVHPHDVRVVHQANAGPGAARNTGIRHARADWVALLDADDYWLVGHLAELGRIISAVPDAELVATQHHTGTGDRPAGDIATVPGPVRRLDYFAEATHRPGVVCSSTAALRSRVVDELGGFGDDMTGEDVEMWARIALTHPVAISEALTAVYVRNVGGLMEQRATGRHARAVPREISEVSPVCHTVARGLRAGNTSVDAATLERFLLARLLAGTRQALVQGDLERARALQRLAAPRIGWRAPAEVLLTRFPPSFLHHATRLRRVRRGAARRPRGALRGVARPWLRRGLYLTTNGTVWRHWRERLPDHLARTKGRRQRTAGAIGGGRATVAADRGRALLGAVARTRLGWVSGRRGGSGYPIVVDVTGDELVLIDQSRKRVARHLGGRTIGPEQAEMRRRWARHVPSASFTVSDDGRWTFEEFVDGRHFLDTSLETQLQVLRLLFRSYADLLRSEVTNHHDHATAALTDPRLLDRLPGWVRTRVGHADWLPAASASAVPTFEDAFTTNLMVTGGPAFVFIDCWPMVLRPAFYSPLYAISRSRELSEVRRLYFEGHFDGELARLLEGCGVDTLIDHTIREALLGATVVLRAAYGSMTPRGLDEPAFVDKATNYALRAHTR